ncbi:MAG TPA: TIGR04255 family protein [Gemmatimonadales bacterium]
MSYRKPTLTETYAELHLAPETLTEARFFDVVPKLREAGFTEIELVPAGLSVQIRAGHAVPRETQRVRCWKPGRKELTQVGEDLFVVNLTGDYPGWQAFVGLFNVGRAALEAGLGAVTLRSVNLLTIDRFRVPKKEFAASKYLDTGGSLIPQWYEECKESFDIDLGRGILEVDGRNRQVHVKVHAASDPVNVTFQANFHDRVAEDTDLEKLLERLHHESNETFEAFITDHMRKDVMGGLLL